MSDVKKLGVLGGMGPMATSVFFERVIKNTKATCDQEHIEMVILNHTTLPDRTISIETGNYQPFLNEVKKAFEIFQSLEVTHIAIPCNTSHFFYPMFETMTKLPIINMVDKTVEVLSRSVSKQSRIGVLATDGTINHQVYKNSIEKRDLVYVIPEKEIQKKVMASIYSLKASETSKMNAVEEIIEYMVDVRGCDKVILACTELSLLTLKEKLRPFCIDAMDILVSESIRLSDKKYHDTLLVGYEI